MIRTPLAIGAAALLLLACGGHVSRAPAPPASGPSGASPHAPDLLAESRAIIEEVVSIRGLAEKTPVAVEALDDEAFAAAVSAKLEREASHLDRYAPTPSPDLYLAYYDPLRKKVVLRTRLPPWASNENEPRAVFAHEVVHALQDQHFGIVDLSTITEPDRLVAYRSLLEGDAELVTLAYIARRTHKPWRRALATADALSPDSLVRLGRTSGELRSASSAERDAFLFPYTDGVRFTSALFRAGGFRLIDQAFAHPPETTEQVLHPDLYLAGERPVPVKAAPTPPGYRIFKVSTLGELGLRHIFRACPANRDLNAGGWGGDRLTVFSKPGKPDATVLVTAWDTEQDAIRAERAMQACQPKGRTARQDEDIVKREKNVVSYLSGLPMSVLAGYVEKLPSNVAAAPPLSPPTAVRKIPPPPPSITARADLRGTLDPRGYTSRWLGVHADVPEGFGADVALEDGQLMIVRPPPSFAFGAFAVFVGALNERELGEVHEMYAVGIVSRQKDNSPPTKVATRRLDTPFGPASAVDWKLQFEGKNSVLRTVVASVCGKDALYVWSALSQDEASAETLAAWVASFRSTGPSPACADFHRENTEDLP